MAALSTQFPTLLDLAKLTDPDGKIAAVVEILNQTNQVLDDMVWIEGNLPTGHRTTIRTGIPAPTWRKLYGGVQPNKGTTVQVTDNCGMLEAYAEIDKALADLNGNTAAFRLSEDRAHIEGMSQEVAQTIFFGSDGVDEAEFTGLAPRYNSTSRRRTRRTSSSRRLGRRSDRQHVDLARCVGSEHGPRHHPEGLEGRPPAHRQGPRHDRGRVGRQQHRPHGSLPDALPLGLRSLGPRLALRRPHPEHRQVDALTTAASGADLPDLMYQALRRLPSMGLGRPVFYMARDTLTMLQRQLSYKVKDSSLTIQNVGGVMTETFHNIPIKRVDVLAADEARVA
jgi:hypothetical protein